MVSQADIDEIRDWLQLDIEGTAHWRRRKAKEYPADRRNLEAAKLLDSLSRTVCEVPAELLEAFQELFEDSSDIEMHSQMLRDIGVGSECSTATEFVKKFISAATGTSGIRRPATPAYRGARGPYR